jgi:WD40 repeat protein
MPSNTLIYRGHTQSVTSVSWSPDGTKIASASADATVQVWEPTGTLIHTYLSPLSVASVSWSPDGTKIASGSGSTVQTWTATSGSGIQTFQGGTHVQIQQLAWEPIYGSRVAAGYQDSEPGQPVTGFLEVLDISAPNNGFSGALPGSVLAVAWSHDGMQLASGGSDGTIQIWDLAGTPGQSYKHAEAVNGLTWSPDSTRIASTDGTTVLVVSLKDQESFSYRGHTQRVLTVAWSPDGTRIVSAGEDTTVQVWNATTGQQIAVYRGHAQSVTSVSWSPDGTKIASASADTTVQIWTL